VGVTIFRREDSSIAFMDRLKVKLYLVDFSREKVEPKTFLVAKSDLGWLWHCRLAHVGMRNLAKLQKGEHILQGIIKKFIRRAQNEYELKIKNIRSDNGSKF
jgi:hypothetical protein